MLPSYSLLNAIGSFLVMIALVFDFNFVGVSDRSLLVPNRRLHRVICAIGGSHFCEIIPPEWTSDAGTHPARQSAHCGGQAVPPKALGHSCGRSECKGFPSEFVCECVCQARRTIERRRQLLDFNGAPGMIRTCDPLIRSLN